MGTVGTRLTSVVVLVTLLFLVFPTASASVAEIQMDWSDATHVTLELEVLPDLVGVPTLSSQASTLDQVRAANLDPDVILLFDNSTAGNVADLVATAIIPGSGITVTSASIRLVSYRSSSLGQAVDTPIGFRIHAELESTSSTWSIPDLIPTYSSDPGDNQSYLRPVVQVRLVLEGGSRTHLSVAGEDEPLRFPWGERFELTWSSSESGPHPLEVSVDASLLASPLFASIMVMGGLLVLLAGTVILSFVKRHGWLGFTLIGVSLVAFPPALYSLLDPDWLFSGAYALFIFAGLTLQVVALFLPQPPEVEPELEPAPEPAEDEETYYTILSVAEQASDDEIRSAYRGLIKEYHPDKVATAGVKIQEMAEVETMSIKEAYDALRTASKRREYDASLVRRRKLGV